MDRVSNDVDGTSLAVAARSYGTANSRQILGIRFFTGSASEALQRIRSGGLLVAPAAPAMINLPMDQGYRDALLQADLAIVDSALMALLWNLLEGDSVARHSGLEYFSELVKDEAFRQPGAAFYVMASSESARKNVTWLRSQGIPVEPDQVYIAPIYGKAVVDPELIERLCALHPRHVVVTVGGGIQERLGLYIKSSVDYAPAIHCIGAAIAFRSGDQVRISSLADRLALGWLLRCFWRPRSYVPRYWQARKLVWLLYRYRTELPPMRAPAPAPAVKSSESIA